MTAGPPLEGKVAIVTGAGRGIGKEVALGLAAAGAATAVVSRTQAELDALTTEVGRRGGTALAISADLGRAGEPERVAAEAESEFGRVDVLVNSAAVPWPMSATAAVDIDEWQAAIEVNLVGPVRMTRAVLPGMLGRGWGRIVSLSSAVIDDSAGMIGANAYITAKSGLEGHSLNLAHELDGSGVTVNVYRPGPVDTSMQSWVRAQDPSVIGETLHRRHMENLRLGKLITAEFSAGRLVKRLCGSAGTGEIWDVRD